MFYKFINQMVKTAPAAAKPKPKEAVKKVIKKEDLPDKKKFTVLANGKKVPENDAAKKVVSKPKEEVKSKTVPKVEEKKKAPE